MVNVLFITHLAFHVLVGTLAMAYVSCKMNLVLTMVYILIKIYLTLAMVYISIRMHLIPCVHFQTLVMTYIFIKTCMALAMAYFPFETSLLKCTFPLIIFLMFFLKHKLKCKLCLSDNKRSFSLEYNVIAQDYP